MCIRNRSNGVGRTRATGYQSDADLATGAGIALRLGNNCLFMTSEDYMDVVCLIELIRQFIDHAARIREERINTLTNNFLPVIFITVTLSFLCFLFPYIVLNYVVMNSHPAVQNLYPRIRILRFKICTRESAF